jgi:hypothetical protein
MPSKKRGSQPSSSLDDLLSKLQSGKALKLRRHSSEIPTGIYNSVNKHVKALQILDSPNLSKNEWIQEAIRDYLQQFSEQDFVEKSLNIAFEADLEKKIEQKINSVRKSGVNISKKKILLKAIEAKLHQEESKILKLAKKLETKNSKNP